MAGPTTKLDVGRDGVAVITLSNPPVNALHPAVLTSLFNHLREAHSRSDVKAVVITGENGRFSAGFDINQFMSGGGLDDRVNEALCTLVEQGPKPTVAAVDTMALGGGCEVAMACNSRVATPGAKLGLPELQLGIIPGFGGTQRLPRLVGLQKACEMMLTSTPVPAPAAQKLGLVDEVAPQDKLLETARHLALDIAEGRRARNCSLYRSDKLEPLGEALPMLGMARGMAAKQARHLTHPQLCLDAIQTGVERGGLAGLAKEQEMFAKAASLDTHKALVHIFFAQRSTKKVKGVSGAGLKARPISTVAVIGGGLMGSGIATACALAGQQVIIKEINQKFLEAGLGRVKANLASRVKKGKMKADQAEAVGARVKGTLTYDNFQAVDLVVEAAIEDVPLKQQIFADLEKACRPDAILSSNTSTIDISLISAKTRAADRVLGAHFFSPAHIMPLLEIVRTDATSKQVILDIIEWGLKIKKTPVVVGNCTGFAVNRVFFPYTQAACLLVDMGVDPYLIDKVIFGEFGMPMGPFRLSDLVGADIGMHTGMNFLQDFPERCYRATLIKLMNERKWLGEKTGRGFYTFDAKRKASPNPDLKAVVEESRKASGLAGKTGPPPKFGPQDIIEFIFFPVVNEGCRVIEEGIVDKPGDLDVASVLGMGFPAYRGGLIKWADLLGAKRVADRLEGWSRQFEGAGLAGFFKPCKYLAEHAASGKELEGGIAPTSRM